MTIAPAARATRREWLGLAAIALPCLVYAMDLTVLNLALPAIAADLSPSAAQQLWIIDIYGFMVAGFLITMGTLGDRIGRRRLLLIGAAAFAAASVAAAFSTSAEMLIAMRALLGIAGATLAPSTLSLIRNMFHDQRQRQFAIGVWIASYSAGGVIGPLVGGLVLLWFSWSAVFLVAVPVMGLLLVVGPLLLPESRDEKAGTLDPASALLSLAAVLLLIYGLKRVAEQGLDAPALAALVAGLTMGAIFVRRQRHLAYPLLDLSLFRQRAFSAAIAVYATSCLAMFGVYFFNLQYLQLVLGLSALAAGAATIPGSIAFVAGSLLAPKLAQRISRPALLVGCTALAALSCSALAGLSASGAANLPLLVAATTAMSLAMAPMITIANEIVVTSAPPERAGAASALSETSAEFSAAMGIAFFGSVGLSIYRHTLQEAVPDAPAAALATLGGAMAAVPTLPAPAAAALTAASRGAFVDALQATALAAAGLLALAAFAAWRLLRGAEAAGVASEGSRPRSG